MNAVERAVVLSRSNYLSDKDFPIIDEREVANNKAVSETENFDLNGDQPLEEVEKKTILKTLEAAGGNKSEAARRLGITRKTLHKKLKSYGVMK